MLYFWDNILIPLLVTLGVHAFIGFMIFSGFQIERNELVSMPDMDFIEARLVEAPTPKADPKPRQPKIIQKPKVEQLAAPTSVASATAESIKTFDENAVAAEKKDLFDQEFSTLFETLEEEEMLLQEETDNEVVAKYQTLVRKTIESKWSRPPSARNGMEVKLTILLVPSGDVVDVRILESSGDAAFDASAVNAVKRVKRFAALAKLEPRLFETYFRELHLLFKPEDLLL